MKNKRHRSIGLRCVIALVAAIAPGAHAQTSQPAGDFREFNLTAVAPPVPLLKYRFDIDSADYIDGDAAPLYLEALLVTLPPEKDAALDKMFDEESESDAELAKMAAERVPWLDIEVPILLIDANRRIHCEWDPPSRERNVETLLPHLNHMRHMANVLALKGRIAVTRGDVDAALNLLRASIVMADRVDDGRETFCVNELVSVGMYAMSLERLEHIMNMPNSPNLYWAIRGLPETFGNQRVAANTERAQTSIMVPAFKETRNRELSAQEWQTAIAALRGRFKELLQRWPNLDDNDRRMPARVSDDALIEANDRAALPAARAHYAKTRNLDAAAAEKVEASKVVAVWYFESAMAIADEVRASFDLPYPQLLPAIHRAEVHYRQVLKEQPSNPFFMLVASLDRFAATNGRTDRKTAALCVVEAIRSYAAEHGGALPATLDAIGDKTPPPLNPTTGKPFGYTIEEGVAIVSDDGELIGRGDKSGAYPLEYRIKIRH
jgi:hypothetical protein